MIGGIKNRKMAIVDNKCILDIMRCVRIPYDIAHKIHFLKKKFEQIEKLKDEIIEDEAFLDEVYRTKYRTHEQLVESLVWKCTHIWIVYPEMILDDVFLAWMLKKEEQYDMEIIRNVWNKCRLAKKRKGDVIFDTSMEPPRKKRKI